MKIKNRWDIIKMEDRNQVHKVHNGKTDVKRQIVNPIYIGLKWGERAKTRKSCTKGANRNLKLKVSQKKKK
jgi:ribosomal protein S19